MSSRYIRIFISSTFSDFTDERDALNKEVFPRLKGYCQQHGFVFQTVDLRWGVTQEASTEQDTIRICLEEVERCQKLSSTPNFFLLLGNRYGWEPLPPSITEELANKIIPQLKIMPKERDSSILPPFKLFEKWYVLDKNNIPAHYILRPRTPGDNFKVESDILLSMLRHAAKESALSKAELDMFFLSATAFEIVEGIRNVVPSAHHSNPVICYFREIDNIDRHVDVDIDKKTRLTSLKEELKNTYPEFEFEITLGKNATRHDYLEKFKRQTFKTLKKVVDYRIKEEKRKRTSAPALLERTLHHRFAEQRRENFFGRGKELAAVASYISASEKRALIVYGEGGVGKSAFMAQVLKNHLETNSLCFFRFVGGSVSSTDAYSLVHSLCEEIYHMCKRSVKKSIGNKKSIPKTYPALCNFFENLLNNIPKNTKISIFVDAIDQLQSESGENALRWIPTQLPENVAFIVSTQGGDYLKSAQAAFSTSPIDLVIPSLDKDSVKEALHGLLHKASRVLQPKQEVMVLKRCTHSGLGLYINMAFQLVKGWKSYEKQSPLPKGIDALIQYLFADLATERQHGKVLTERVLGYLALTHQGITEDEIMQILTDDTTVMLNCKERFNRSPKAKELPFMVWARMRSSINDYLKEVSVGEHIHLQFYHRILEENVTQGFLPLPFTKLLQEKLCDFFRAQKTWFNTQKNLPNIRKITALPYHLRQTENVQNLKELLIDKDYFQAKVETNNLYAYTQEALWVNKKLPTEKEQKEFAQSIFTLVVQHNETSTKSKIIWSDLHSLLIYSENRVLHRQFFSVPETPEDIIKLVPETPDTVAKKIYEECVANKINYYRRMGLLGRGENLVLEELAKLFYADTPITLDATYTDLMEFNKNISLGEVAVIEQGKPMNSKYVSQKLQHIKDVKHFSRLLYELGFIQFFQGKFKEAFNTILTSSVTAREVHNSPGELISRCVAYHIQAISALFDDAQKEEYMEKYKNILDSARREFMHLATVLTHDGERTNAARWRDANTIEHAGIIAANMDDLITLTQCENEYSSSPWVQGNDDKSNLYFMQARLAELKARLAVPQDKKLYHIACEKMEYCIQYEVKRVANSDAKIDHEAQLYLCLGRSYKALGNKSKARSAWEKAANLHDEPGNHVWKKEAQRLLQELAK